MDSISSASSTSLLGGLIAGIIAYIVLPSLNIYHSWRGQTFANLLAKTLLALLMIWCASLGIIFLTLGGASISRKWALSWLLYSGFAICSFRYIIQSHLNKIRKEGRNLRNVALIGYGPIAKLAHSRARLHKNVGYQVKYLMEAEETGNTTPITPFTSELQRVKDPTEIKEIAQKRLIDEVWIALPPSQYRLLEEIMYELKNELVKIRWLPDLFPLQFMSHQPDELMGISAIHLNASPSPGIHGLLKNAFDRLFSLTALITLAPILLAISLAIKITSEGPIFFRQARQGHNGKIFHIFKFRTMKVHRENGTITQAKRNDDRVTTVGAFLRRTSLDELPQFINVLLGDMSVVGPRPHAVEHNIAYSKKIEGYMLRHAVKPGITGWAQINGWRGETDTLEKMLGRVECDIYYINNWSFLLDIQIIWRTAFKGWSGKDAY